MIGPGELARPDRARRGSALAVAVVLAVAPAGTVGAQPEATAALAAARPEPPAGTAGASTEAAEPAVEAAGDANLESLDRRRGLTFAGSLGGGLMIGFGIEDSVGRGGALSLRLGHVATRRTVITFEFAAVAELHKPSMTSQTETNTNTSLTAGAQYYVSPSLWLRLGGGVGVYRARQVQLGSGQLGNATLVGPAVLGGVGLEVMRFRWAALCFEIATSGMVNRDGVMVATGAHLGLAFD